MKSTTMPNGGEPQLNLDSDTSGVADSDAKEPDRIERCPGRSQLQPCSCWLVSVYRSLLDLEVDPTTDTAIFPPFTIFAFLAIVFWSRYVLMTSYELFRILHPDETFQAIEVAHSEVYGYGFRPRGVCTPNGDRTTMGSWMLFQIYALLFRLKDCLGWSMTSFEVGRLFHGFVAATLPFSVYQLARSTFEQSRDVAVLASILVAFSDSLILLGLHPSAESVLSPVIFLALAILVRLLGPRNPPEGSSEGILADLPTASGLLGVGFILSLATTINPDTSVVLGLFLFAGPVQLEPIAPTAIFAAGALLGLIFELVGDPEPFSPWSSARIRCPAGSDSYLQSLHLVVGGNHVHSAALGLLATLAVSLGLRHRNIPVGFFLRIGDRQSRAVKTTCRLGAIALGSLAFQTATHSAAEPRHLHDGLVLALVAGASALHHFYRKLEVCVRTSLRLPAVVGDALEAVLCCEILIYIWLGCTSAASRGHDLSSGANLCLKFVGQQADVSGVILDFPLEMTGAYALLNRNVPIVARLDRDRVEWGFPTTLNGTGRRSILDAALQRHAGALGRDIFLCPNSSDLSPLHATYNYVITDRDPGIRGYYQVHQAGGFKVLQRSVVVSDTEAAVLESEGGLLLFVGNYDLAKDHLVRAMTQAPVAFESWRSLVAALYLTGDSEGAHDTLARCHLLLGQDCDV